MALPDSNISVAMVKRELGAATNDVGRLCIHPNINKWSKWKPIRNSKVVELTEGDIKMVRAGFDIPYQTTASELINFYRNNTDDIWTYLKPRGGNNVPSEPYRLGDFKNYEKEAGQFYQVYFPTKILEQSSPQVFVDLYRISFESTWLDWNLLGFENHYFGAIIVRSGTSGPFNEAITTNVIGNDTDGVEVSVALPNPTVGSTYEVFAFIAQYNNPPFVDRYYPLEGGKGLITYSKVIYVTLDSYWSAGNFHWELKIENDSGTPFNLGLCSLYLRYGDNAISDLQDTGEVLHYLNPSPLVVPAQDVYETSGVFFGALPDFYSRDYGYMYFTSVSNPSMNQILDIDFKYPNSSNN